MHRVARSTCADAFVCAPQVVAPNYACKLRSSSSDPLLLLALLAQAGRSTSWRTSTAAAASFMEHCGCAAQLHTRCRTVSQPRPGRPDQARLAVQCRQHVLECARSCGECDSFSIVRLTHPCRYFRPYPIWWITQRCIKGPGEVPFWGHDPRELRYGGFSLADAPLTGPRVAPISLQNFISGHLLRNVRVTWAALHR